ncbi:MAG: F0F1 ATP synthase subunit alpha, partial [Bacilli bacterium]|nr:F0F1 ATP synthase subunit alpha [Bacilli bacterium]
MQIKPNEISSLIKEQIKEFKSTPEYTKDIGTVVSVGDGIAIIYGLRNAILGELLEFSSDSYGMVMNLEEDSVSAVLLSNKNDIKEGEKVKRTGRVIEVPVGDEMLGRVVDSLGRAIDGGDPIKVKETRPIETKAPTIMERQSVNSPLETGIKCIDSVIPIGKGQRELIIGDRQTGKT